MKVKKINWERKVKYAISDEELADRILEDIRRATGKAEWSLSELNGLWASARATDMALGAFIRKASKEY